MEYFFSFLKKLCFASAALIGTKRDWPYILETTQIRLFTDLPD